MSSDGSPPTDLGKLRVLSSTASIHVSPLALGGMSIGDAWASGMGSMDKESSFKLLDFYFESGGNFIDTSNNYQDEQSETWIGEWMSSRENRDQMVIATKYTTGYKTYELGKGRASNYVGNSRRSLHMSVRDSLQKLQTDYIDIFIEEIMDSLHILVEQGKVLYLGISDSPAWLASAANYYARAHGKTPFSIYQGRWNVMLRDFEREIIPMARYFGMALAPWDVLGGGKFQSRKALEERKSKGESLRKIFGSTGEQSKKEFKISEALAKVAEEHGMDSVQAIALAYVMSKAPRVFPIVGGRKIEHLKSNIDALRIRLSLEEIEYLESVVEFEPGFPNNFLGPHPRVVGKTSGWLMTDPVNLTFGAPEYDYA
ncbi:aryl-alcohol dehydrogenase Aad14, putative [Talaromyces stipitatus ATCC 10500]|uniref:Aryl-alcohol dehydrogenase Aad14, putative n=1 Tax=Talaromyces stipitatus (strain ATCC 10500 / CBS 375.48 / QM 6759 / NRRL 1006) TaxID=441959 RepID=B8MP29_TALSN|nr:aryl-alcohol dehydrogenase Aad14, putative [Talaromyces stipitatus ATCC 10500]EED14268.1 aryl-alcohol dehydrogenase Aad14, putative [Talaromyces stipitatus ATCC 10500]